jgi:hypothetical protein
MISNGIIGLQSIGIDVNIYRPPFFEKRAAGLHAYGFGSTVFGEKPNKDLDPEPIIDSILANECIITIYGRDGGLKKRWYIQQDSDYPVEKLTFELNDKGCGGGSIEFAKLDIPIDPEDYITVKIQGSLVYRGMIEDQLDPTVRKLKIMPYHKRFDELLFSGDYTAELKTYSEIMEYIIDELATDTNVTWNVEKVDTGKLEYIYPKYVKENAKKILDNLTDKLDQRIWGVDEENEFFVYQKDLTKEVSHYYYISDKAEFGDIKITKDYSQIKATEYFVYQQTDGESLYIDQVGNYGNVTYPILDIRNKVRKIQDKISISEYITDENILKTAYGKLENEAREKITAELTEVDIVNYLPAINDVIVVEDYYSQDNVSLVDCESLTYWYNATLYANSGRHATNCVMLFAYGNQTEIDFGKTMRYCRAEKIGFYIISAVARTIEVSAFLTTPSYQKIKIQGTNKWEFFTIDFVEDFRYIYFKNTSLLSDVIRIDDITIFCYTKNLYTMRINNIKYDITNTIKCDITAGDIKENENDRLFWTMKQVKYNEVINGKETP